jgi:hypothetical protein
MILPLSPLERVEEAASRGSADVLFAACGRVKSDVAAGSQGTDAPQL